MFPRSVESVATSIQQATELSMDPAHASAQAEALVGIDDVQKSLNRSRASVYRYTNTDPRNLNPCLLYTSPSPRDVEESRMPSSA